MIARAALGVGVLLVLALSAAPATAQPPGPAVGASATYRWTSSVSETVPVLVQQPSAGGQVTLTVAQESAAPGPIHVTYAVVRGDRRSYTLQIVTHQTPDSRPLSVTQVTVDRASGKARRSVTQRAKGVVATPDSAARPLREAAVPQASRESITVPAGQFTAAHGTAQGAEVWVSDTVPVLGLVKGVWPGGTLELVSSAPTGAKDLFKP
jgi:hypothetical protein